MDTRLAREVPSLLNKVPQVALGFWIIKILSTTVGETGADFLAVNVGLGTAVTVGAGDVDLLVRALSMGKLHHAMMGTAAVAIGTAAAIPGTLVNLAAGGGERNAVRFGHPSGTLRVGAEAMLVDGEWTVTKAIMSRSARVLMEGWVRVPG